MAKELKGQVCWMAEASVWAAGGAGGGFSAAVQQKQRCRGSKTSGFSGGGAEVRLEN